MHHSQRLSPPVVTQDTATYIRRSLSWFRNACQGQKVSGELHCYSSLPVSFIYLLRFERVDNLERTASRRRPAFSSHLILSDYAS